ncbi:hypothetical protein BDAP_000715 [Binucleata daphniae]
MSFKKSCNVYPGNDLPKNTFPSVLDKSVVFGTLYTNSHNFVVSKSTKHYIQEDDVVIGKVTNKTMDYYKIDIGFGIIGYLPVLNFPNATKRNKPELEIEQYVMAKVTKLNECSVMLICEKNWKIDGYVFDIGCYNCKVLMVRDYLSKIGKEHTYEIGIGLNGKIWINACDVLIVNEVYAAIKQCLEIK